MNRLIFVLVLMCTSSLFAETSTSGPSVVELKELKVEVYMSCNKDGISKSFVGDVLASPYENSKPEEFSFKTEKNKNIQYKIIDGKTLVLKSKKDNSVVKIGTLNLSTEEYYNSLSSESKDECKFLGEDNFSKKEKMIVTINKDVKYLVNVDTILNVCEKTKGYLGELNLNGKNAVKANFIIANNQTGKIIKKSRMSDVSSEVCTSGVTTAQGIGSFLKDMGLLILALPVNLLALILGLSS